jgi:hypothetical protein
MRFGISLAVRSMPGSPASKFSFRHVPELDPYGVDVARDDILQNLVSRENQLTNGSTPWRGPREKSVFLMQMLIEACSSPWDIILDCTYGSDRYVFVIFYFSWLIVNIFLFYKIHSGFCNKFFQLLYLQDLPFMHATMCTVTLRH